MSHTYTVNHARYAVKEANDRQIVLQDLGPWDQYQTITNDAEWILEQLLNKGFLKFSPRVLYYDSEEDLTEIIYRGNQFIGFKPGSSMEIEIPDRFKDIIVGE